MILELDKKSYPKIAAPFLKEVITFPLTLAVIRKRQPGWVFVDDTVDPASALVVTRFGFMQLAGPDDFCSDVFKLFESPKSYLPSYLLWYSPPLRAQEVLGQFSPSHVRQRERARFDFRMQTVNNLVKCPVGFEKRFLDKELVKEAEYLKVDIGSRFWASTDDFLNYGLGACVVKGDVIVSLCYSACVVDGLAEIDVITREEYRGKGFAMIAAQTFIAECLRRGIEPTWDCFVNNTASMRLASRLGFTQTNSYAFYSFNVPVPLMRQD
ncbi:MAG: GNAT family N-acetyltransferase [Anaerolineales bacterium]|nr:GNAT family N-acetyltransferase [Anaerolineales bacterium]